MNGIRLDRLLASLGYGSRREVGALIAAGEVRLDGAPVYAPSVRLPAGEPLELRMVVGGEPLDPTPPLTLLMNKPLGVVCSRGEAGRSIYELLPDRWRARRPALSTIGRLDADTSGLLLFTDDGGLLHRVISPRSRTTKVYEAELERPLRGDEAELFAGGRLVLAGEARPLAPATLEALAPTRVRLGLVEGRYHQVRRMFAAAGNRVVWLHRIRIGDLALPNDLTPGAFRRVLPGELELLLAC
ncbi:MAG TPA: pseudouridine synthase [Caulobacteraceae bacterium]|nr:pseudouridine synthase [Caulobacteraceae bacterium]